MKTQASDGAILAAMRFSWDTGPAKAIGVTEARGKLCGIVGEAHHEGVSTPISHRGEVVAYVVPRGLIESLARRAGLPVEDLLGDDCGRLAEGGQP